MPARKQDYKLANCVLTVALEVNPVDGQRFIEPEVKSQATSFRGPDMACTPRHRVTPSADWVSRIGWYVESAVR